MARRKKNPLRQYLEDAEVTQQEFADRLSEVRGWRVWQTTVARWVTDRHIPSRDARAYIAKATRGAVPVDAW